MGREKSPAPGGIQTLNLLIIRPVLNHCSTTFAPKWGGFIRPEFVNIQKCLSRALIHHPAFAEKNQRFSSLPEETAIDVLIGVANGMNHLVQRGVRPIPVKVFLATRDTVMDCLTNGHPPMISRMAVTDL